jgi:cell division inhibitor SepF
MGIFTRLKDFIGLNEGAAPENYDYVYSGEAGQDYQEVYQENNQPATAVVEEPAPPSKRSQRVGARTGESMGSNVIGMPGARTGESMGSNVIGMPGASKGTSQVVLMEPVTFEEMPRAVQALKERQSVVLNLTRMQPDEAQRAVDFVAGATYCMDGQQERIGDSIFLFAPPCVQVMTQTTATEDDSLASIKARSNGSANTHWEEPVRFAQY